MTTISEKIKNLTGSKNSEKTTEEINDVENVKSEGLTPDQIKYNQLQEKFMLLEQQKINHEKEASRHRNEAMICQGRLMELQEQIIPLMTDEERKRLGITLKPEKNV